MQPLNHELWLNADVLVGPGEPKGTALPAEAFVDICTRNGPAGHVLSIGWTTELAGTPQEVPSVYSWKNIFQVFVSVCTVYRKLALEPRKFE